MIDVKDDITPYNITITLWDIHMLVGPQGVKDFIRWRFPDWTWKYCNFCEDVAPLWGDFCTLCWAHRGET